MSILHDTREVYGMASGLICLLKHLLRDMAKALWGGLIGLTLYEKSVKKMGLWSSYLYRDHS